jgi:hypothetical protein
MVLMVNQNLPRESSSFPPIYLFTVRVWAEKLGQGKWEWRGKLLDVSNGEERYFQNLANLAEHISKIVSRSDTNFD